MNATVTAMWPQANHGAFREAIPMRRGKPPHLPGLGTSRQLVSSVQVRPFAELHGDR